MFTSVIVFILLVLVILLGIKCWHYSIRLQEISNVVAAITQGDLSSRMSLSPSDKLGTVARNINELTLSIQKRLGDMAHEKEKLEAILSSLAEGVVVISPEARLIHVNPRFLNMFEVRSSDWVGKYYWEIIANPIINESIREAVDHKKMVQKEIHIVHPQEAFFNMSISPVLDSSDQLISLALVFYNITELKKFESLRTEFVANVSHELKTPLTSIKGFVETLQAGAIDDKAHAMRFLDIMSKQAQRLENLVNDLLVLSSLESQDVKLNLTKASIVTIVQSVVFLKKQQIESLHHTLILDIPSKLPLVNMDTHRMEQVFINLLDNAIKFTPASGEIQIKAKVELDFLRIDVIDNGPGISSEHLSRVFERFWRADKARNQDTGGTGLGLSIVKHIVDAHKGRIGVESIQGKGSRFSVFLPLDMI